MERETININGTYYYVDSLSQEGIQMVADAKVVGERMQALQKDINIMNIAKSTIVGKLVEISGAFEAVPDETDETPVKQGWSR